MDERGPTSPCLNICSLDELGVCRGCFRTLAEIAEWTRMQPAEQWAAVGRAERRRLAAASGTGDEEDRSTVTDER
jgi:predicted Fe-S protein YdhL (DUF1289 family)